MVGHPWTRDRPVAEASVPVQHTTFTRDPAAFEPAIPASERPQTCALDLVATGIGLHDYLGVDPSTENMEISVTIYWKWLRSINICTPFSPSPPWKTVLRCRRFLFQHRYSGYVKSCALRSNIICVLLFVSFKRFLLCRLSWIMVKWVANCGEEKIIVACLTILT